MGFTLPHTIQHYTLRALLGEGDLAVVYRAVNTVNGQEVALKVLRADSPVDDARAYFQNEGVILAQVSHPNIPTFYEYLDGETPCLAMGIVDGKDGERLLAEMEDGRFFPVKTVLEWGVQIADALAYLHGHAPPISFRDLKSAHIVVNRANRAWLVDFNLARILPPGKRLTDADRIGTEGFAAPEQYQGVVSPLVDVYALGATLHYLLTRIDPRKERRFTYAPVRSVNPDIPKSVGRIVAQALAYEPEDRFQEMEAMGEALKNCLVEL